MAVKLYSEYGIPYSILSDRARVNSLVAGNVPNPTPRAKQRTRPNPGSTGRSRHPHSVRHLRAPLHAATDNPKANPRHRSRLDLPDGDHLGVVDGDDAQDCPPTRRVQFQICRGVRASGADEYPFAGAGPCAAPIDDRQDAVAA